MPTAQRSRSTGGTPGGPGSNGNAAPGPGSLFRLPKFSTRRRFVSDSKNPNIPVSPSGVAQVNAPFNQLDQLDILLGEKLYVTGLNQDWTTGGGKTLHMSPFFPASTFGLINFKLQAAYNSFNLIGPLASLIQAYRPMWGSRLNGLINPNPFAKPSVVTPPTLNGTHFAMPNLAIDIPLSFQFDEYYDLDIEGNPRGQLFDAIVSPQFMSAQARVVTPTVIINPALGLLDTLGSPVSREAGDTTSTYALNAVGQAELKRDAYWTAQNPAANPPVFPWQYTRDYFTQATQGQNAVNVLIQNTGVSVGQVMSLFCFCWDPAANTGQGGVVPFSSIESVEVVTGGSLLNYQYDEASIKDRMQSLYPNLLVDFPDGVFVLDYATSPCGSYITNEECINTYLVNGVSVNVKFRSGLTPGATTTVYVGVEALKMATS